MPPSASAHDDVHAAAAAIHARLDDVRSKVPPPVREACLPDSVSTVLRNLVAASAALAALLLLGSLFAAARFMGNSLLLTSAAACAHAACAGLVLGGHVADAAGSAGLHHLAAALRRGAARHGTDAFAHGALFGATLAMAVLMHLVHAYYGGVAACVTEEAALARGGHNFNLTGGYGEDGFNGVVNGGAYAGDGVAAKCGASASASVGFVSFISGWLFWIYVALAAVLYTKRQELLTGEAGSSSQYDEIGAATNQNRGFEGDFPTSSGLQTMHV